MRYALLGLTLCLAMTFTAFAAGSGATLNLKGDQAYLESGGKSTPLPRDAFEIQSVEGTKMRFLGIGEDAGKERGIAAGLYIFEEKGRPVAFAPTNAAELCTDVKFSPNGKILAMDAGATLMRSWFFFSFPDMKPMGEIEYYDIEGKPSLIWNGNKGALVSSLRGEDHGRTCGYDPCGPVSVDYYPFAAQKIQRLLPGTGLCDYILTGLKDDGVTVTAQALCLQSPKDWEAFPGDGGPRKEVTARIP